MLKYLKIYLNNKFRSKFAKTPVSLAGYIFVLSMGWVRSGALFGQQRAWLEITELDYLYADIQISSLCSTLERLGFLWNIVLIERIQAKSTVELLVYNFKISAESISSRARESETKHAKNIWCQVCVGLLRVRVGRLKSKAQEPLYKAQKYNKLKYFCKHIVLQAAIICSKYNS